MVEHNHLKIRLLFCIYDTATLLYNIKTYTFCNVCAMKMGDMVEINSNVIPNIDYNTITKVICNVVTNGYEYELFGHKEDRDFYINNADKW